MHLAFVSQSCFFAAHSSNTVAKRHYGNYRNIVIRMILLSQRTALAGHRVSRVILRALAHAVSQSGRQQALLALPGVAVQVVLAPVGRHALLRARVPVETRRADARVAA